MKLYGTGRKLIDEAEGPIPVLIHRKDGNSQPHMHASGGFTVYKLWESINILGKFSDSFKGYHGQMLKLWSTGRTPEAWIDGTPINKANYNGHFALPTTAVENGIEDVYDALQPHSLRSLAFLMEKKRLYKDARMSVVESKIKESALVRWLVITPELESEGIVTGGWIELQNRPYLVDANPILFIKKPKNYDLS